MKSLIQSLAVCVLFFARTSLAADLGTAFTYQGSLENPPGTPVTDTCDFRFGLFDAATGGVQRGTSPQTKTGVAVEGGVFLIDALDFGPTGIDGTARWLAIEVKCTGDPGFTLLSPRVSLSPVPHALALPGLRTEQNATSPTVIGGYSGNQPFPGAIGVVIGGGGAPGNINQVIAYYGTIGGGRNNQAGSFGEGGAGPQVDVTVGGGSSNRALTTGATVGGGLGNTATGRIGLCDDGHFCNTDIDCLPFPTCHIYGPSTIAGGNENFTGAPAATVSGGANNRANGVSATVGGGQENEATGYWSTAPGGRQNQAGGFYSFAAGRSALVRDYNATGESIFSCLDEETCGDEGAFVWADSTNANFTSSGPNQFLVRATGGMRLATGNGTVPQLQGVLGSNTASAVNLALQPLGGRVGIGTASPTAPAEVVGGYVQEFGQMVVRHSPATAAYGWWGAGTNSVVFGANNIAASGGIEFRLGTGASTNQVMLIQPEGRVSINRNGASHPLQVGINSTNGNGAHLTVGGVWTNGSDRNSKENFEPIDNAEILSKVAELPITRWKYKGEEDSIHHIGPVSQDFHAAFGLGGSDTHIGTLDADGVALAAIQGLHGIVQEKDCEIENLKSEISNLKSETSEISNLKSEIQELKSMVHSLAAKNEGGAR